MNKKEQKEFNKAHNYRTRCVYGFNEFNINGYCVYSIKIRILQNQWIDNLFVLEGITPSYHTKKPGTGEEKKYMEINVTTNDYRFYEEKRKTVRKILAYYDYLKLQQKYSDLTVPDPKNLEFKEEFPTPAAAAQYWNGPAVFGSGLTKIEDLPI